MRTLTTAASIVATCILIATVTTAIASQDGPRTLEKCATLLPQGAVYTFEIVGNIDATQSTPTLTGEMSVSDGTEVDRSGETAAFAQCVAGIFR